MFDYVVTPSQRLTKSEIKACWDKFDSVIEELIQRGLEKQFIQIEAFVLNTDDDHVLVKLLEVIVKCEK